MKMEMKMTLDEAILHCEEVASRCDSRKCADNHRQLAEWLKELKERRASELPSAQPEPPTDDCISKQAVIDAIRKWKRYETTEGLIDRINNLPYAQPDLSGYSDKLWKAAYERGKAEAQLDIIKCKDCKHRGEKPIADGRYWCEINNGFMYYCSDAERRTDE